MEMNPTIEIFVKRVNVDGQVTLTSHWVWNATRFMNARFNECEKENETWEGENPGKGMGSASVVQITKEQYHATRSN